MSKLGNETAKCVPAPSHAGFQMLIRAGYVVIGQSLDVRRGDCCVSPFSFLFLSDCLLDDRGSHTMTLRYPEVRIPVHSRTPTLIVLFL